MDVTQMRRYYTNWDVAVGPFPGVLPGATNHPRLGHFEAEAPPGVSSVAGCIVRITLFKVIQLPITDYVWKSIVIVDNQLVFTNYVLW